MVSFKKIKHFFCKPKQPTDIKLDCSKKNIDKLIELTLRMNKIDLIRKKNELFVDSVIHCVNPASLKKDGYGNYVFLNEVSAAEALNDAIKSILNKH